MRRFIPALRFILLTGMKVTIRAGEVAECIADSYTHTHTFQRHFTMRLNPACPEILGGF